MSIFFPKFPSHYAKEKGGALKLAKESRQIENGFILVYGGVEENFLPAGYKDIQR